MSEHKHILKKDATFHANSGSQPDLLDRTYGFLKAARINTPIPKSRVSMDTRKLVQKLQTITKRDQEKDEVEDEDEFDNFTSLMSSEDSECAGMSEFELKRKQFDTAEFTITRGIKLSQIFCPKDSGLHLPLASKEAAGLNSFDDMKTYCRQMNIHLAR
ncbi:uncharacterized protein LOC116801427 [Drosophila sechellia]|uniref:uncharacterized protein LOC116801427 n=1 Tax=Drosophila sechellia TaxID=7238 RepID=UPI0013DE1958|nr:uncharacterized protein LOC116801427 [Drosophila sechellia]